MPYVYYCLDNFFQVWVGSKVFIFRFGLSARCSYSGLGWVQGVHIQVWVGSKVFIFLEVFIVVLTKVLSRLKI